ncbi:MAG: carbamoyltransferase [Planctomycetes bacterium]|jgi:carbamoyltransferase|nr:carbamoyltransferase [Planctomycetota bacterium]
MYILGLTHPMAWNNAAALMRDGEIVLWVEEERLNRFKQSHGVPPLRALEACLAEAGIGAGDVDAVGVGWDRGGWGRWRDRIAWDFHFKSLPFEVDEARVRHVRHHLAHALSAFYPSPFERAAVITLDGTGESESGILGAGEGADVRVLATVPRRESWGYLYGKVTEKLGFAGHRDEGKVMGLAAYGEPDPARFDFIDWRRGIPRIDKKGFKRFLASVPDRDPGDEITDAHRNLAATVQQAYERGLLAIGAWLARRTGLRDACLAGGCALNCAANGALLRSGVFERIFVQPAAHDAGTAAGAAFQVYRERTGRRPPLAGRGPFTGPRYGSAEAGALLASARLQGARRVADPAAEAAALVAAGKIVGWFQGRMEVGPRALGGRSLLADPRDAAMRDRVNRVKGREPWRPLAPSVLAEDAAEFLVERHPSPFMLLAFTATPAARARIPAVVHVDGTVRAQVLEREAHPLFHRMVSLFKERTGVGAVLNTSFNGPGEPIVGSPRDAVETFYSTGIDALVIEDWVVVK